MLLEREAEHLFNSTPLHIIQSCSLTRSHMLLNSRIYFFSFLFIPVENTTLVS